MGRGGLDGTVHSGAAFCIMKAPIPRNGTFRTNTQTETTRGYASGTPGTSFARKAGPHPRLAEELLKTFEANHATYVNARKALEAAEKERRRQKALARKRARAEAAKLRAAKAKAAEKAAKAEEKTREKAKAKAAEASKEKTQA